MTYASDPEVTFVSRSIKCLVTLDTPVACDPIVALVAPVTEIVGVKAPVEAIAKRMISPTCGEGNAATRFGADGKVMVTLELIT